MNNTFSFRRFGLLWAKYYTDHGRTLLWTLAFMLVVPTVAFVLTGKVSFAAIVFATLIFSFGVAGLVFRDFDRDRSRIGAMMLPASLLEKYLFLALNLLLVIVLGFLFFWFDACLASWAGWVRLKPADWVGFSAADYGFFLFWVALLHASILCSRVVFRRRMILGFLCLALYMGLLVKLIMWIPEVAGIPQSFMFSGSIFDLGLIQSPEVTIGQTRLNYQLSVFSPCVRQTLGWIIAWSQPVALWVVGYFKLKESQIK